MAKHIQCPVLSRICRLERSCGDISAALSATPQCGIEAFDEGMTVDRFAKEGDGTGRLRTLANSLFGKGGNEDDRHIRTAYGQLVLQFQPTHFLGICTSAIRQEASCSRGEVRNSSADQNTHDS